MALLKTGSSGRVLHCSVTYGTETTERIVHLVNVSAYI